MFHRYDRSAGYSTGTRPLLVRWAAVTNLSSLVTLVLLSFAVFDHGSRDHGHWQLALLCAALVLSGVVMLAHGKTMGLVLAVVAASSEICLTMSISPTRSRVIFGTLLSPGLVMVAAVTVAYSGPTWRFLRALRLLPGHRRRPADRRRPHRNRVAQLGVPIVGPVLEVNDMWTAHRSSSLSRGCRSGLCNVDLQISASENADLYPLVAAGHRRRRACCSPFFGSFRADELGCRPSLGLRSARPEAGYDGHLLTELLEIPNLRVCPSGLI